MRGLLGFLAYATLFVALCLWNWPLIIAAEAVALACHLWPRARVASLDDLGRAVYAAMRQEHDAAK